MIKVKRAKDILKYVATGFLILLVLLCVYTFIVTDLMKKDYVNVFGYTYFVVASGSMSGTIEVDDVIFVKITKDVKTNDIITYKNKDGEIKMNNDEISKFISYFLDCLYLISTY